MGGWGLSAQTQGHFHGDASLLPGHEDESREGESVLHAPVPVLATLPVVTSPRPGRLSPPCPAAAGTPDHFRIPERRRLSILVDCKICTNLILNPERDFD